MQDLTACRAAKVASKIELPMTSDRTTEELYGYKKIVLNESAARRALAAYWSKAFGVHTLTESVMDLMICDVRARADRRG